MAKIDAILAKATEIGASDVHIAVSNPPLYRHLGELKKFKFQELTPNITKNLIYEILTPEMQKKFERDLQLDFCYELKGVARFRANVFHQRLGVDAAFRIIPLSIPTIEESGLPEVTKKILEEKQGLILVTGVAGQGKSTTLASMVAYLNEHKSVHILTIEDPIEFIHSADKKGIVNQRQVGRDAVSSAKALKAALQENPDVIIIDELKDRETLSLAMTAADAGLLVIGTMSTPSAHKTVDWIMDSALPEQQNQVRNMLADSLKWVITQRLLRHRDGTKQCLATEVLVATNNIVMLIRDNKTLQIPGQMQTGKKLGMQLMDEDLQRLLETEQISVETALSNALNKKLFRKFTDNK